MMNSLRLSSPRSRRMNLASPLQQISAQHQITMDCPAGSGVEGWILEANGFDAHISCGTQLRQGDRITIHGVPGRTTGGFHLSGIAHWIGERRGNVEAGIALDHCIPDAMQLKMAGCQRESLRYSCRVNGLLEFNDQVEGSIAATAINYCRQGACFRVLVPPRIGATIQFTWLTDGSESCLDGVIHWVIGQGGAYLAGAEFIGCYGYSLSGTAVPAGL